ncbi:hypothetical protein A2Z22_01465 [Candidatus Woesebacteria bacterium RBG_16_34_12]|uniref:Lipoprotein n=1 Tax=Candidatus Woesebacteria bacterium RBG_16_34_12 TaxID=1802480 RepID=A0A1F7XA32_9BACT|nr:MAG: hypothetical protein A2Z22_01465 [Candidatus Woesebacteria bacterium RBG_16_34_12]
MGLRKEELIIFILAATACSKDVKATSESSPSQPTKPKSTSSVELVPPVASQTPELQTRIWTPPATEASVPTNTPELIQTSTRQPTNTPNLTETQAATKTEELKIELPYQKDDQNNLNKIRISREEEQVILVNPLIEYIVKVPRPLISDAVFGVLAIETEEGVKGVAVFENADCEFAELSESGQLGDPKFGERIEPIASGLWQPHIRFKGLKAISFIEYSSGTIPVFTSQSFTTTEGNEIDCPKESAFGGFGELPYDSGEIIGSTLKEFIEGFNKGFFKND